MLPFAEHFRKLGWKVDAMARDVQSCAICTSTFDTVKDILWTRNPLDLRLLTKATAKVKLVVESGNYDIVHVHTPIAAFITRFALRNSNPETRPTIIYTAHGFHFHRNGQSLFNRLFLTLEKRAARWTDVLITINHEDYLAAVENKLLAKENVYLSPGIGIDPFIYKKPASGSSIKCELNLPDNAVLLLCISEFTKNKRHPDQIRALKELNRKDVHLLLAGVGKTMPSVQKLAIDLELKNQVHFLEFRDDIPALIREAQAVLLTSQREGFPRSVLEAFSGGTPVIGTTARGTKDLLENQCGLLVPIGDVNSLATAIATILADQQLVSELTRNATDKLRNYTLDEVLAIHTTIYSDALKLRNNRRI